VHPNTKERYSRDVIAPAIFEHQQTGAQRDGGYAFLNLNHPYQGLGRLWKTKPDRAKIAWRSLAMTG